MATAAGLEAKECGNPGHWQLLGGAAGLCNYWPFGKQRKFLVGTSGKVKTGVDFQDAIAMAKADGPRESALPPARLQQEVHSHMDALRDDVQAARRETHVAKAIPRTATAVLRLAGQLEQLGAKVAEQGERIRALESQRPTRP